METPAGHAHATPLMAVSAILITVAGAAQPPNPACVIDMGSNTFRRIVGSFDNGRYIQRSIETVTLGVGDDLARHGRISDAKLAEIAEALAAFKQACVREGAQPAVAIGTAAFREAPNGTRAVELASGLGIRMEIATETRESDIDRALPRLVVAATLTRAFGYSAFELTDRELGAGLIIEAGLKKPD